jgi:organic radical activating enzyme
MKIKISEIFSSLQGEGKYAGYPMLFIRLSGCTRACWFCDTKYHTQGVEMKIGELVKKIKESKLTYVCWTGGEPLLQRKAIREVITKTRGYYHHLESNGDLLEESDFYLFDYLAISPKVKKVAEKVAKICLEFNSDIWDIKVVTDLGKEGVDMLKFATMLMPLSLYESKKDLEIQRKVWNYCVQKNLKFTPRYQFWVWGKKRGI